MARTSPVDLARSALNRRIWLTSCDCGWHGRPRTHEGHAFRDARRHRKVCPYRHTPYV